MPVEVSPNLGSVNRVTAVVTRPIDDEVDEIGKAKPGHWLQFVYNIADESDNLDVGELVSATDIVAFSDKALRQNQLKRASMIVDMKPVAHVTAVSIDRQRPTLKSIYNNERDQLFRKLKRSVVVRAVACHYRQAVGPMPCTDKRSEDALLAAYGELGA